MRQISVIRGTLYLRLQKVLADNDFHAECKQYPDFDIFCNLGNVFTELSANPRT